MQKGKVLVLFFLALMLFSLNTTFAQEVNETINKEEKSKLSVKKGKSIFRSLGLDRAKSIGLIRACTSEEYDLIGSFHYYAPIFIKNNMIYFLNYLHSIPLNKEADSSVFNIDDVQFELKLGLKKLVKDKWLFLSYYSHRSAIKVDQKGFANIDSLNVGLETGGFTLKDIDSDINWSAALGFVLHNTEPFRGVNLVGEIAIDLFQIGRRTNMGIDLKFDSVISSHHGYGEEEAKFRVNFFSRDGTITSLYAAYLNSNHLYGLEGKGFHFGVSWEHGLPPKGTASTIAQWTNINGLFFLGFSNGANGAIHTDLGAEWSLGGSRNWEAKVKVHGWGWIVSQGANNAFYTIIGGATLYYREFYGFGFAFNHRSNHLIHQSFSNPASSINFTDFFVSSKGWHMSNREYALQFKEHFPVKLNYFFSLGRVQSSQFVDTGKAALKYGIHLDFPEIAGKITPFMRYYGESVDTYQLNNIQIGIIISENWFISTSYYQDEQAYRDDRFLIIGIGKIF